MHKIDVGICFAGPKRDVQFDTSGSFAEMPHQSIWSPEYYDEKVRDGATR
jgi:hypothetical protein